MAKNRRKNKETNILMKRHIGDIYKMFVWKNHTYIKENYAKMSTIHPLDVILFFSLNIQIDFNNPEFSKFIERFVI